MFATQVKRCQLFASEVLGDFSAFDTYAGFTILQCSPHYFLVVTRDRVLSLLVSNLSGLVQL